jgi:hypothetical protein
MNVPSSIVRVHNHVDGHTTLHRGFGQALRVADDVPLVEAAWNYYMRRFDPDASVLQVSFQYRDDLLIVHLHPLPGYEEAAREVIHDLTAAAGKGVQP